MKIKTVDLIGFTLDWAVGKAGGGKAPTDHKNVCVWLEAHTLRGMFNYSTDWAQGGPILEQEGIEMIHRGRWLASFCFDNSIVSQHDGPTPLVAAMRCFVYSRLGDEVDVPEELR